MLCIIISDDVCVAMNAIDVPSLILMSINIRSFFLGYVLSNVVSSVPLLTIELMLNLIVEDELMLYMVVETI